MSRYIGKFYDPALRKVGRNMDGLGTLTWEEFVENAENIVRVSNEISDHWQLIGDKSVPGQAYLKRLQKKYVSINYFADDVATRKENANIVNDDPFEAPCDADRPLIVEHHVLWSLSYAVPILYFNGWKSDFSGVNPVSVEAAQKLVSDNAALNYTELSQAIHPILGTPYLHLHPCMTQQLIKNMQRSDNKLVSWLSVVGPVAFGLQLEMDYFMLTMNKNSHHDEDLTSLTM